ncbi:DUF3592 domain-containing protein [Chitinophaga polysaccharea]|uniref:DUF3592 domain-containing protein n=1 Tax=Chitinophaga polysaccharea TaxID=1293035 RepID=UPI0014557011|nr:DUF3592 domain-containing protein [Chitinophaga polysaccharea]NLR59374.1 DUF3592 domain-containing protein [Chitinophaga polysaccharea]
MWYKLYLLAGIILLTVSLYKFKQSIDFIRRSERAVGTVISLEDIDGAYSPVFAVKTKENDQIIYHHAAASNPAAWDIGEEATFLYDPGNPGSATMMSYFWLFNWAILFLAIAIPLVIVGAGYFLLSPLIRLPEAATIVKRRII